MAILGEGEDDLGLVHRGRGAGRCVGEEHEALGLFGPRSALDHDGDTGAALLDPPGQALEAVGDLEGALFGGYDSKRQVSRWICLEPRRARAQRGVGGA